MKTKTIKYGKTVRRTTGVTEHAEILIELSPNDYEEQAIERAKKFVNIALQDQDLSATVAERLNASRPPALPPSGAFNGA